MAPRDVKLDVRLHKPSGQYRKRIGGKDIYLGTDHRQAIEKLRARIDRQNAAAGAYADGSIRLAALAGLYEDACNIEIDAGRMQRTTFSEYDRAITEFLMIVGESRTVSELQPDDFARVRQAWIKRLSPYAANRYITAVKRLFNWAIETATIKFPPLYGRSFKTVPKREVREYRAERTEDRGERNFTPDELRSILNHKDCVGVLRTCILLALNCGFYSIDCGELTWGDIVERAGVLCIDRRRRKTNVRQRAPLWPEVVAGILPLKRPDAKPDGLVFTQASGAPINDRESNHDWLSRQFDVLHKAATEKRSGVSFGSLKHTHASAVGDHPDHLAAFYVRGHVLKDEEVHGTYDIPTIDRLKAVTDLAYARLFLSIVNQTPTPEPSKRSRRGESSRASPAAPAVAPAPERKRRRQTLES